MAGRRGWITLLKLTLTAAVLVWLGLRLRTDFADFRLRELTVGYGWLAASLGAFLSYQLTSAAIWHGLTRGHNAEIPFPQAAAVWCYSTLGKYIPGKAWLWWVRYDEYKRRRPQVSAAGLLRCFFLEYFCGVGAGFALLLLSLLLRGPSLSPALRWSAAGALALSLLAIHPALMDWAERRLGRRLGLDQAEKRIGLAETLRVTLLYLLNWLVLGLSVFLITRALAPEVGWSSFLSVSAAYAFAGLAGFLALFAPSGIGVREAVLIGAMTPLLGAPRAAVLALLCRLVSTLGEMLSSAAGFLALRRALPPAKTPVS